MSVIDTKISSALSLSSLSTDIDGKSDVVITVDPTSLFSATSEWVAHLAVLHGLGTVLSPIISLPRAGVPASAATFKSEIDDEGTDDSMLI